MRLLDFVWDACFARSAAGWTRSFRAYRVVNDIQDPAFDAVYHGDLCALQRLLCSHEATVNDQSPYGRSLVWVSILQYPHAVMQLLTNNSGLCLSTRLTPLGGSWRWARTSPIVTPRLVIRVDGLKICLLTL